MFKSLLIAFVHVNLAVQIASVQIASVQIACTTLADDIDVAVKSQACSMLTDTM
jgi:hypothetical protein